MDRDQVVGRAEPAREGGSRTLVVLEHDRAEETLRAALGDPAVGDGPMDLLVVYPDAEYEARLEGRRQAGVRGEYSVYTLAEEGERLATRLGREWVDRGGEGFEAAGSVGSLVSAVQWALREQAYATVCLPKPRRSLVQRFLGLGDPISAIARGAPARTAVVVADSRRAVERVPPVVEGDASREDRT